MEWRLANVMTIFRKGKKEDPGNYRPVNLPSVGKLGNFWHLLKNNWKTTQSLVIARFMRRKSWLINLISFCENVAHLVDQGKPTELLFYFIKAFDTVSHRIFLDRGSIPFKRRGDLITVKNFLKVDCRGGDADLLSLVTNDGIWGNGRKLQQWKISLDIRKWFFTESVVSHWNRVPKEVVMVPSLAEFMEWLDEALSHMI